MFMFFAFIRIFYLLNFYPVARFLVTTLLCLVTPIHCGFSSEEMNSEV